MIQSVIILVLTALPLSFLWWRSRFEPLSEVSITHKAVGIRLPGLWCRAVT